DQCAELFLEAAAYQRVESVGADDQVVTAELIDRSNDGLIARIDANCTGAALQQREQFQPADRGEADAVDLDAFTAQIERDVLPALHARRDGIDGLGVIGAQELQRLVGEHHAKAPGRTGRVLLEQVDLCVRVALLPEIGEVKTAGASADHGDAQGSASIFDSALIMRDHASAADIVAPA